MTIVAMLLEQRSALCRTAVKQPRDVNEAYLVVHGVMADALDRGVGADGDLGVAMAAALEVRAQRLARLAADA